MRDGAIICRTRAPIMTSYLMVNAVWHLGGQRGNVCKWLAGRQAKGVGDRDKYNIIYKEFG